MRQIFLVVALIAVVAGMVLGAYLPWTKATSFVEALRNMRNVGSFSAFVKNFDEPLNRYSPVGNEEIVKFLSSDILQLVSQNNQPENVARVLVEYIEPRLLLDNPRHLITGAQMRIVLWSKSHNEDDYLKAEQYYLKALAIGPRLPPVLYGLLDLYRMRGDKEKMRAVAKSIFSYWPDDDKIGALVK